MVRRNDDRAEQQTIPVKDRAAEIGINLNTILTGLLLAATVGAVTLLFSINDKMSAFSTAMAVVQTNVSTLRSEFDEHRHNQRMHR